MSGIVRPGAQGTGASYLRLYRTMDVLLEYREIIHKETYFAVADLLSLEVDLIFFSTCFEQD